MKLATKESIRQSLRPRERRRFQRVKVDLSGRYMLADKNEYGCFVINMSPGGVLLNATQNGNIGEQVIAYIDHIGRIEGKITRTFESGFAMSIEASTRKRDKLAAQLTWLANRHALNLPEDRRHERILPKNPDSQISLPDGRIYRCRIQDLSLSGAAVMIDVKPAIGTQIMLGRVRGRVVRHIESGIAIEFATVQLEDVIEKQVGSQTPPELL
ncbi:MAG: PilZ domain-containing protein [Pseudomonadota bacterium]